MSGTADPLVRSDPSPAAQRWLVRLAIVEAMVLTTVATAARRWVPMPRWSWVLGRAAAVPDQWRGRSVTRIPVRASDPIERRVARAVERAAELLPGEPSCLASATAGQVMLRRRGRAGVVVIGLRRPDDAGTPAGTPWDAHAWLLGSRGALSGGPAARGFTATTVFEVPGRATAAAIDLGP